MSEPESFLSRWSRRKHDAQSGEAREAEASVENTAAESVGEGSTAPQAATTADVPEVDLASLPSIDSITAATDVRAFLAPGVPAELTRAALRRAWATDPQIRDFVGIAENQWDFNAAAGVPGFSSIDAADVRRLATRILGDHQSEPERRAAQIGSEERPDERRPDEGSHPPECATVPEADAESVMEDNVDREKNVTRIAAAQNKAGDDSPTPTTPARRQHGGALPQ